MQILYHPFITPSFLILKCSYYFKVGPVPVIFCRSGRYSTGIENTFCRGSKSTIHFIQIHFIRTPSPQHYIYVCLGCLVAWQLRPLEAGILNLAECRACKKPMYISTVRSCGDATLCSLRSGSSTKC